MYDNVGSKLKGLAAVVCVLGIIGSVIAGISLMIADQALIGILYAVLGSVFSWLGTLSLYGLGEAAEQSAECNRKMNEMARQIKDLNDKLNVSVAEKQSKPVSVQPAPKASVEGQKAESSEKKADHLNAEAAEVDMSFFTRAEGMRNAAEIANAFAAEFGGMDNENIREMMKLLEEQKAKEILGSDNKYASLSLLKGFYKHGGRVFAVDRSAEKFVCPVCGTEQVSRRQVCMQCGAIFSK